MSMFNIVFNKGSMYDMLFINVKSVLEYKNLETLKKENPTQYKHWCYLEETKHNVEGIKDSNEIYETYAVKYPEFTKIVAITYATLYVEKGEIKRLFKKVVNVDEGVIINSFFDILREISHNAIQSTPVHFPTLCGYNIISNDIPLLIKRFLKHKDNIENNQIPLILKRTLDSKPWESDVIDIINVWKFNGFEYMSLELISDFIGLKKTIDILSPKELSKYYWDNIENNANETLENISLQSATQTNLTIQLINLLRQY